ncbi:glycosyl hydrolase family 16 [Chryseobacterium sp. PS-8]|uniref:Glycosyl hydrolase family 16 n=1 Tax=Chryseobacterium indicum TaxID=2766954 RepID=A0ABS9CDK9_9FLAO|nr:carbohydrate binding domain-containing protein [Chryseobacterium sp. PS-8]MCF2221476.1 glycosyl hydrolase family 16 [Chryseobacterium sp. PS-8]
MKNIFKHTFTRVILSASLLVAFGCQRDISELEPAEYSKNPEVFIDAFSSGLNYSAFGGSDVKAFDVDTQVKYSGTTSMKFAVPDYGSPEGAYAGGSFYTSVGRDLSDYNALTFWIKATQAANIDVIGFGNDLGENKYQVSLSALPVNTNWKKVIIPIPDPSKLKMEKGMFFYSEGPENNKGYTFWVDEVKFEKLGTISYQSASILNGNNKTITSFVGVNNKIDGLTAAYSMPNGATQAVNLTPYYFNFKSSNTAVASVDQLGNVNTIGSGSSVITATLGGNTANGNLTINSSGSFVHAPVPTQPSNKVISIFSDAYTNVPVDYYNGYWAPYQTTQSADFTVNNDHVLNYTNFNFVGIQSSNPTVNASLMSTLHFDFYFPNTIASGANLKIQVVDFGADGVYGGSDDKTGEYSIAGTSLASQAWKSFDIKLTQFTGLSTKAHIGQIVFVGTNISGFYADNIYYYNDGSIIPATPTAAAPVPTLPAAGVLSVFSDSYTNVSGTDFNPNWGQSTAVFQTPIAGNNTLKYAGLNYQGTQFASPLNVSSYGYVHIDYYTANSTNLNFYLISPGPVEKAYALSVPSGIGANTNGWKSVDIPLSSFSPVVLSNIIQFKVDGNGDIFFDNIYFHN